MRAFLAGMPKAELHLHLECTLSPATIVKIARRNGLDYFTTIGEVEQSLANRPPGLMGFLDHHFKSQNVMQSRQDFYNATYELIRRLKENNIIYADLFFDPQAHTSRGIAFDEMFAGGIRQWLSDEYADSVSGGERLLQGGHDTPGTQCFQIAVAATNGKGHLLLPS